jgi:hypothetical protein
MKSIILILAMFFSANLWAVSSWVSVGTVTQNFLSTQKNASGGKTVLNFAPALFVGTTFPFFYSGTWFTPSIGYAKYSAKDNTTKNDIILQYHLSTHLLSGLDSRFGFSNYITTIGGNGKSLILNNGDSTATFYSPSETKKSYTASLDLGLKLRLLSNWSFGGQFSVMRFLSSDRRSLTHIITCDYLF